MNTLSEKQNTPNLLSLLKLQRYTYNQVSKLAVISFILSVILPIILGLIELIQIPDNAVLYINFLGALCVFACLWLSHIIKSKKEQAAKIQYFFDTELFGLKKNSFICNETLNELLAKSKKEAIQKLQGLENWYSIKDNLNNNDAILSCQWQNIKWDKKLRKIYLFCIIALCLVSVFVILSIAILKNLLFSILWTYIFLLMPIVTYCTIFMSTTIDNLKQQEELNSIFKTYKNKKKPSTTDLICIEEKIFHYRKSLVKIPNWFFNLFRKRLQKEADLYSEVESENYSKK